MSYNAIAQSVVSQARTAGIGKILSLDLETKVMGNQLFLTGETILGISAAWTEGSGVTCEVFTLEEELESAEWRLLDELDMLLLRMRPLVLVGYYLTQYDIPLLAIKMRKGPRPYWGIENAISRAFMLDLKDPVRFVLADYDGSRPFHRSLSDVIQHPRFNHLPLMRTKSVLPTSNKQERGKAIYDLWKSDRTLFRKYSQGDAHDALLISEELFPSRGSTVEPNKAKSVTEKCSTCGKSMRWNKGNWECSDGHMFYCPHCDGLGGPHAVGLIGGVENGSSGQH
jgi:DNA polymerase elongation subunit (family B)